MPKNKYYFYDHEACAFREVQQRRSKRYMRGAVMLAASLVMAGVFAWAMDAQWIGTPEEAALKAENQALQKQIATTDTRMTTLSKDLDDLAETDRSLYRKLLKADPISEDVRQVGVGGADPHEELDRFSGRTSDLMRKNAQTLDRLERKVKLQGASYQKLTHLAEKRRAELTQLPALLPVKGPIVSGFGLRKHPILKVAKMHDGLDIVADLRTPVMAPADGVVKRVVRSSGYGNLLEIAHPKTGYSTLYGHLSGTPDRIKKGYRVERGETVAFTGNTGRSTGPHLHYEVRDASGQPVNPVYFFAPSMTPDQYRKLLKESNQSGAALDY